MDEGINIGNVDPGWMSDGGGIQGEPSDPIDDDYTQWDTRAWSRDQQSQDDVAVPTCGAPDTGTWFWGAIDGECQWIDSTTC